MKGFVRRWADTVVAAATMVLAFGGTNALYRKASNLARDASKKSENADADPSPACEAPRSRRSSLLRWAFTGGVFVVVISFAFGHELIDYRRALWNHAGFGLTDPGISVQPPSVHTRERLMNDRFEQIAWLDEQLSGTKGRWPAELAPPQAGVAGPDLGSQSPATDRQEKTRAANPGLATTDEQNRANHPEQDAASENAQTRTGARKESRSDYRLQPNPLGWFQAIDSYRDVVRAERALTMLDDRHDLDGTELYFLSFDATILADTSSRAYAAIEATLSPDPDDLHKPPFTDPIPGEGQARARLEQLKDQDMEDIYFDWLDRSQTLLTDRIKINSDYFRHHGNFLDGYDEPELSLKKLICTELVSRKLNIRSVEFLVSPQEACNRALHHPNTPDERIEANESQPNERARTVSYNSIHESQDDTQALANKFAGQLDQVAKDAEAKFKEIYIEDFKRTLKKVTPPGSERSWPDYDSVVTDCNDGRRVWDFPKPPNPKSTISVRCPQTPQAGTLIALTNLLANIEKSPAPVSWFDNGISPRLKISGCWGDKQKRSPSSPCGTERDENFRKGLPSGQLLTYLEISYPPSQKSDLVLNSPLDLDCIAADAEMIRMNSASEKILPGRGERLETYFRMEVGRMPDRTCSIVLQPRIHAGEDGGARSLQSIPSVDDKCFLGRLRNRLERLSQQEDIKDQGCPEMPAKSAEPLSVSKADFVEAFSYAVTPRLRRAYAVKRASASEASGGWLGAMLGFGDQSSLSTEASDPEVVGYHPLAPDAPGRAARFGWVIGPQREGPAPWQRHLQTEQFELGALVAVPSWLRTVLLKVCTGSVSGENLQQIARPQIDGAKFLHDCHIDTLRLPGTAADVARRLGVEVVKIPYLKSPAADATLVAGHPGHLVLEGGRLWRSTVVMLGSQRADRIEVLPNMEGLSVEFTCVERPGLVNRFSKAGSPTSSANGFETLTPLSVPVRVWTSEGVTNSGFSVYVYVPEVETRENTCPKERPMLERNAASTGTAPTGSPAILSTSTVISNGKWDSPATGTIYQRSK